MTSSPDKHDDIVITPQQTVKLSVVQTGPPLVQRGSLQGVKSSDLATWLQKNLDVAWPTCLPQVSVHLIVEIRSTKKGGKTYRNYSFKGEFQSSVDAAVQLTSVTMRKAMDGRVYFSVTLDVLTQVDGQTRHLPFQGALKKKGKDWSLTASWSVGDDEQGVPFTSLGKAFVPN
ncbi:hypothetical protein [Streptomyces sp. NPDC017529]|uniref:hypothetical protein n=1 Tax=Streptomyces sp. NPDC017529 TaxID=3365000 RepID=UPI00379D4B1B